MTIEQKAVAHYGLTKVPEFAGYILADGTMLNFSIEGRQRDIDHRAIGDIFSGMNNGFDTFMEKFMRRGNIRCSCSSACYGFEFSKLPTREQLYTLQALYMEANYMDIPFFIERNHNGRITPYKKFYEIKE